MTEKTKEKLKKDIVVAEDKARATKKVYDVSYKDTSKKLDVWLKAQTKVNKLRERAIKCGIYYWR